MFESLLDILRPELPDDISDEELQKQAQDFVEKYRAWNQTAFYYRKRLSQFMLIASLGIAKILALYSAVTAIMEKNRLTQPLSRGDSIKKIFNIVLRMPFSEGPMIIKKQLKYVSAIFLATVLFNIFILQQKQIRFRRQLLNQRFAEAVFNEYENKMIPYMAMVKALNDGLYYFPFESDPAQEYVASLEDPSTGQNTRRITRIPKVVAASG